MTKSELIKRLAAHSQHLVVMDAEIVVDVIFDAIVTSLSRGQRVEIRDFGCFSLHRRPARVGRNPKTGQAVKVPAKYTPYFKAGKELRERVDG